MSSPSSHHRAARRITWGAPVARGALGTVYRGHLRDLDLQVAVKVLHPELIRDAAAVARFVGGARHAARIEHPNVIRVHEVGRRGDLHYLVTAFVPGIDLDRLLRTAPGGLRTAEALWIARQAAAGLFAAHAKGVVHRNLEPGNLLLHRRGGVLLNDFGAPGRARPATGPAALYAPPARFGRAPEAGSTVDVFALGRLLLQMLTGRRPGAGPRPSSMRAELSQLREEDVDPRVLQLTARCVAADPGRRPRDGRALLESLAALAPDAPPKSLIARIRRSAPRGAVVAPVPQRTSSSTARRRGSPARPTPRPRVAAEPRYWLPRGYRIAPDASIRNGLATILIHANSGVELRLIPAGRFLRGSVVGELDEQPIREIHITRPFYLSTTPITQAQWRAVMPTNPSHHRRPELPVDRVRWLDARAFAAKLGARLPSEAEWEYAARAGWSGIFPIENFGRDTANFARLRPAGRTTSAPGNAPRNRWGLQDMAGNVWEWCEDVYVRDAYRNGAENDPIQREGSAERVLRGGSWRAPSWSCRISKRHYAPATHTAADIGFRIALTVDREHSVL